MLSSWAAAGPSAWMEARGAGSQSRPSLPCCVIFDGSLHALQAPGSSDYERARATHILETVKCCKELQGLWPKVPVLSHEMWGPLVQIHFLGPQPKLEQQHLQPPWELWECVARGQEGPTGCQGPGDHMVVIRGTEPYQTAFLTQSSWLLSSYTACLVRAVDTHGLERSTEPTLCSQPWGSAALLLGGEEEWRSTEGTG